MKYSHAKKKKRNLEYFRCKSKNLIKKIQNNKIGQIFNFKIITKKLTKLINRLGSIN